MYKKAQITDIDYEQLKTKEGYYTCLQDALKIINYKAYAIKQVREKLRLKGHEKHHIERVITYLIEQKMLDDTHFEESYTNSKVMQGYGPTYIKRKLYEKGIKQSLELDPEVLEERLVRYFNAMYQANETRSYARTKFIKKMLNKGYELAMIESIFDGQDVAYNNEKLKNEYNKVAEKLKKRYGDNDYQLNQQIKQRLQQKGYSYQEVMAVMREDDE